MMFWRPISQVSAGSLTDSTESKTLVGEKIKLNTRENTFSKDIYSMSVTWSFTLANLTGIYLPNEKLFPVPPALYPKGLEDPKPFPVPNEDPPLYAEAIPTPVADEPNGPALPVPNPAPFPPETPTNKIFKCKHIFHTMPSSIIKHLFLIESMSYRDGIRGRRWLGGRRRSEKRPPTPEERLPATSQSLFQHVLDDWRAMPMNWNV